MPDDKRYCNVCNNLIRYSIGGFNNYSRRGVCEECHKNIKTKVCHGPCGKEKPLSDFTKIKYGQVVNSFCKVCNNARTKKNAKKRAKVKVRTVAKTDKELANELVRKMPLTQ